MGCYRTVPAGERTVFKKLTKPTFQLRGGTSQLVDKVAEEAEHILGKSLQAFKIATIGNDQVFYIGGNNSSFR